MDEAVIEALRRAVLAAPDDHALRLHLAQVLVQAGRAAEAIGEAATVLAHEPGHAGARHLMSAALGATPPSSEPPSSQPASSEPVSYEPSEPAPAAPRFDWSAAESEVHGIAEPMFVDDTGSAGSAAATDPDEPAFEVRRDAITLRDVGGMADVKRRLDAAFLAPLRNPDLRRLYGKSLRGGLLLYGPPGCGKTFIARALAGELGAAFISVGITDILDMYIGSSERNLHELFQLARREAPCVLFLDEIDAIGQRRTQTRNAAIRGATNQLLTELDGVDQANEGLFVLAATNQPWDVDPALRRPGRLDRTVLVLPPDRPAREEIFRHHLSHRPIEGIELGKLAQASEGLSGADIAYACELASERALLDSIDAGSARMIGQGDVRAALAEIRPSVTAWLDTARNVVQFGDDDGTYADLRTYLKKAKRL